MRIGIVGNGVVGSTMARFFGESPRMNVFVYDKFQEAHSSAADRAAINRCEIVFVCVPTPTASDGLSCDLTAVEECVGWLSPPICIRSTIVPGTVRRLVDMSKKAIAFSPEYIGEQSNHPWRNEMDCGFLIVGGSDVACDLVAKAYREVSTDVLQVVQTDSTTAELCKYMENCFLATKVAFVNQFFDIADQVGVDFGELRRLWLMDARVGPSHTSVTAERGFRGKCLPKDLAAMVWMMRGMGGAALLEAVLAYNRTVCANADARGGPGPSPPPRSLERRHPAAIERLAPTLYE